MSKPGVMIRRRDAFAYDIREVLGQGYVRVWIGRDEPWKPVGVLEAREGEKTAQE